ncbi:MAG: DNA repair protein RecO [Candidatus Yanofskybacteria bacterium]|nr:DNA repair protein RecO [Candidatus Yanofskybacteria bacterium]
MRTRAIILKKQDAGECDQLVTCYTEEFGKLTAVAKSALKPNSIQAMHLDIFNLVDFELINGRATPIITGAQVERTYGELKTSLTALAGAYFFTEVFNRLVFDYQRDNGMWNFLTSLLDDFNGLDNNFQELFRMKQASLIGLLGYAPNTKDGELLSVPAMNAIFESLAERKLHSLNFMNFVLK